MKSVLKKEREKINDRKIKRVKSVSRAGSRDLMTTSRSTQAAPLLFTF